MGYALVEAALAGGHEVVLVSGPTSLSPPSGAVLRPVTSALEMQAAVDDALAQSVPKIDVIFAVAAVTDFRPERRRPGKPPKSESNLALKLVPNPDILFELGRRRSSGELEVALVGFALQAGTQEENLADGRAKLERKHLDMIVVNHRSAIGAAVSEVTLVFADGRTVPLPKRDKADHAARILGAALETLAGTSRAQDGGGAP